MVLQLIKVFVGVLGCVFLCTGCAERGTLSGGTRDTTAPYITYSTPKGGSLMVTEPLVTIGFSDYVQKDIRNAISIQPRTQFTTSYAGDEITIEFAEPLRDTTTYAITLGTQWKSLKGNEPRQAYSVVFSSGPNIDTGKIQGFVRAIPTSGVVVLCYLLPDTSTVAYSVQLGNNGQFEIPALRDGNYRVVAVRDANNNLVPDATEDLAVASFDVVVTQSTPAHTNLYLQSALDTTAPLALRTRATFSTEIQLEFSEPIVLQSGNVTLSDSSGATLDVSPLFQRKPKSTTASVRPRLPLGTGVHTIVIGKGAVTDSAGNANAEQRLSLPVRTALPPDTTKFRVLTTPPKDTTEVRATDSSIVLVFSQPVSQSIVPRASISTNTGSLNTRVVWRSANEMEIQSSTPLMANTKYTMFINLDTIQSSQGDTLVNAFRDLTFRTEGRKDFGSASGVVIDSISNNQTLLLRAVGANGRIVQTVRVKSDGTFMLDSLPPGEYTVDFIVDTDGNGLLTRGSLKPFKPSERWIPTTTTLRIRARWAVEGVTILLKDEHGTR